MPTEPASHTPGDGLQDRGPYWTYDGEIVPDDIWRSLDSAEEELSEETELAFIRYWMEHAPSGISRFDRWYDLWGEHHELEQQLKRHEGARSTAGRLEATAIEGRLRSVHAALAWIEEGMAAVLEGQPLPPEPAQTESVKVADLFGSVVDTHLRESELRDPLARQRRRR
jgi:hypothetical protein